MSGPPGTGKTTCLRRLIDELPLEENNVRVLPIVNCMTLGMYFKMFLNLKIISTNFLKHTNLKGTEVGTTLFLGDLRSYNMCIYCQSKAEQILKSRI